MRCLSIGLGAYLLVLHSISGEKGCLKPFTDQRIGTSSSPSVCFTGSFSSISSPSSRMRVVLGSRREDLQGLAAQHEADAVACGQVVSAKLQRMRTAKAFIQFAKKRGAEVHANNNGIIKVSKDGAFWNFGVSVEDELQNSARKKIITAFKAMDIAFDKK
eukprot:UN1619